MEEKTLYTGKIHWIAYLRPFGICFIIWAVVLLLPDTWTWKNWIVYLSLVLAVYNAFYYSTIKVILTSGNVYLNRGLLPWQKSSYHLSYDQIFECYYHQSILGRILNYGTLTIAKSDGVRSGNTQRFLTNPKKFSTEFEAIKNNVKKDVPSASGANPNVVEQLEKLIEMKQSGNISEEEFTRMKQLLMGKDH